MSLAWVWPAWVSFAFSFRAGQPALPRSSWPRERISLAELCSETPGRASGAAPVGVVAATAPAPAAPVSTSSGAAHAATQTRRIRLLLVRTGFPFVRGGRQLPDIAWDATRGT